MNYKFCHLYLLGLFPLSQHTTFRKLPASETLCYVRRCDSGKSLHILIDKTYVKPLSKVYMI
jgi:hypothetical protein